VRYDLGINRKDLQREIEEAERELDAAKRLSDVRAAAGYSAPGRS
jgi:hypothetical protein